MIKKDWLRALTGVDIALIAGLSLVIGFLFTIWANLVGPALELSGNFGIPIIYGFWFLGAIIPAYIIRKPGTAFLGETIAAHIELLTGSKYGWYLTVYGVLQGLASELVFAAFGYKKWGFLPLALAGALPAVPAYIVDYFRSSYGDYALSIQIGIFVIMVVSGAVFAMLAKVVIDVIARTGALNNFAIGRQQA